MHRCALKDAHLPFCIIAVFPQMAKCTLGNLGDVLINGYLGEALRSFPEALLLQTKLYVIICSLRPACETTLSTLNPSCAQTSFTRIYFGTDKQGPKRTNYRVLEAH